MVITTYNIYIYIYYEGGGLLERGAYLGGGVNREITVKYII